MIIYPTRCDILAALQSTMLQTIGHAPDQVGITDKLERFDTLKKGDKAGWYVCNEFAYTTRGTDGKISRQYAIAAAYGDWRQGYTHKFCSINETELDRKALAELQATRKAQWLAKNAERDKLAQLAQSKAVSIWQQAQSANYNHPYLMRKQIQAHGARQHFDRLICPIHDLDGAVHNIQTITADGTKRFLFGGRKRGLCCLIGDSLDGVGQVIICEGFATGASLYEAYGLPVIVAFDAGNLLPVAQAYRARYPATPITLCADNDRKTPGNPGLTKAREVCAKVAGVALTYPTFPSDAPIELSDFNDAAIYYSTNNMEVAA